jgi:hypothetical protein
MLSRLETMSIFVITAILLDAWEVILRATSIQQERFFAKAYKWGSAEPRSVPGIQIVLEID